MRRTLTGTSAFGLILVCGLWSAQAWSVPESLAPASIEKDVLRISRNLKPIPDELWREVAGNKISEKYTITRGDTLYDISNRLFGDPKYWPKIWSLNNPAITNPHLIRPGKMIAFLAGSGTELPSVTVASASAEETEASPMQSTADAEGPGFSKSPDPARLSDPGRSREWAKLPRQKWEGLQVVIPEQLEQVGLGRDIKEKLRMASADIKFNLKAVATSAPIEQLGEIFASGSRNEFLSIGDKVFIRTRDGNLQIGQTYTATGEASKLEASRKDVTGYSYRLLGQIQITGKSKEMYIGKVISCDHIITRGSILISTPPPIPLLNPIPGPKPMNATVLVDHDFSTFAIAQFKQVFLDRGSEDGLAPGMMFEVFRNEDPRNEITFSEERIHKEADIMVVQVSERFSAAIITNSIEPIYENSIASLMTELPKSTAATAQETTLAPEGPLHRNVNDVD